MNIDRIKTLCEQRGLTFASLEREVNLPNNSIRRWANSSPAIEKVQRVASFFDVSLDYIQGSTDDPKEVLGLSDDERLFLEVYARAKESDREDVQDMLKIIDRMLNKEE